MTFSLEAPHFTPAPKGEPGKSPFGDSGVFSGSNF